MPLYEYECDACGGRFEVIQKFSEVSTDCRRCGKGPVRRLVAAPAFQFKGTGWYVTDYAQKGKSGGDAASAGKETSGDKAAEEKKTDVKKSEGSSSSETSKKTETTAAAPPASSSKD
jgi:putative FmdB family regulatory protein